MSRLAAKAGGPAGDALYASPATRTPLTWRFRRYLGFVFIAPWLIAFLAFDLIPTGAAFYYSFTDWSVLSPNTTFVGIDNYREMFSEDTLYWKSVRNTLYYTAISVPLGVVAAFILALMLNARIRFQGMFRTLFYLPAVIPTVAASIVWLWLFDTNRGLINYGLSLVGIDPVRWLTSPDWSKNALIIMSLWAIGSGMVIYLAGLQNIPVEFYEAAEIDGAGTLNKIFNITIPLMTPTIFFNLLLGMIGSFQVFNAAFILTEGGPINSTLFYMLHLYNNAFSYSRMGYACAMAVLLFVTVLMLTIFINWTSRRWVFYS